MSSVWDGISIFLYLFNSKLLTVADELKLLIFVIK